MTIKRIDIGARMSQAAVRRQPRLTAGRVAEQNVGRDVARQTGEILDGIDALLASALAPTSRGSSR